MAYELDNGDNSLTEPNFCIVYCCSIFVGVDIFSSALYLGLGSAKAPSGFRGFPSQCIAGVASWFRGVPGLVLLKKSEI